MSDGDVVVPHAVESGVQTTICRPDKLAEIRIMLSLIRDFSLSAWNNGRMDFEALVDEHKDAVYRQMIRVCGNHADAEDVLMEALLKAYRHLDQLRQSAAFRSWLAQIARRVCWQLKEREALVPLLQLSTLEEEGRHIAAESPSLESKLAADQMKALIATAISKLPEHYREVYQLRDVEEIPGEQVAQTLGLSTPAMKSRLHRARALIREQFDSALLSRNTSEEQLWK
jgi:RNA polymerase sigma-70 factor, ECF subfamily